MTPPSDLLFIVWLALAAVLMLLWLIRLRRPSVVLDQNGGVADDDVREHDIAETSLFEGEAPKAHTGVAPVPIPPLAPANERTLADMLDGIDLPYDLSPVTSVVDDPDRHLVFLTTHSNAEEVGRRFADELERLGFRFEPVDFDQAVGTRGDDIVSVKVVPDADQVDLGDGPRYGAAGRGDVALELWVGRTAAPPAAVTSP